MKLIKLIKLLFGLGLLTGLLYIAGIQETFHTLTSMPLSILLVFILIPLIMLAATTINLAFLLYPLGLKANFPTLLRKQFLSRSLGFLLPGKFGELSLALFLRDSLRMGDTIAAIAIDKFNTLIVLGCFAFVGILIFLDISSGLQFASLIFLLILSTGLLFSEKGRKLIRKFVLGKHARIFTGFSKSAKKLFFKHPLMVFANLSLTILLWLSWGVVIRYIFFQFGEILKIHEVAFIHAIGVMSAFVPVSISGIGVRESIVAGLYSLRGVSPDHTVAIYLLFLFFSYLYSGISFLLFSGELRALLEIARKEGLQ